MSHLESSSKKRRIGSHIPNSDDSELEVITNESSSAIESELQEKYIGTVLITEPLVTPDWDTVGNVPNRPVDSEAVKKLVEKFKTSLNRMNRDNHIVVTIDAKKVEPLLKAFGTTAEDFRKSADALEYPLVTEGIISSCRGVRFVLQAGQHRLGAIEQLYPNPADRWWPARVYSQDLSLKALDRLRENVNVVHTGLSDGERFLHLMKYQESLDELDAKEDKTPDDEAKIDSFKEALANKFHEFDAGSGQRAKQLWNRPLLRKAIINCLKIPGLRAQFSLTAMGDILTFRFMKVFACQSN